MSAQGPDTRGYDHQSPLFWDATGLDAELRRVFTICNGCRLCYNLCPSFPELYKRVDAIDQQREDARAQARAARGEAPAPAPVHQEHDPNPENHVVAYGSVEVSSENLVDALTKDDLRRVVDLCYNCKLCYPICPYKPPHEFEVDFPRLMVRSKIVTAKQEGVTAQDKFLGAVDAVGSLMTKVSGLANAANHSRFQRMLMEKTVGIHRDRLLPEWASETFVSWWRKREAKRAKGPRPIPSPQRRAAQRDRPGASPQRHAARSNRGRTASTGAAEGGALLHLLCQLQRPRPRTSRRRGLGAPGRRGCLS